MTQDVNKGLRFDYSPLPGRPALNWAGGARMAVWVVLNIEHFEFGKLGTAIQPHLTSLPEIANYSWRDYGNRVGIWRMLEIFDQFPALPVTVALNSDICRLYPPIIEAIRQRQDWEIMAHGLNNSTGQSGMDEATERALIAETLGVIEQSSGLRPTGWLTPGFSVTYQTPDLLAEAGISYVADWMNDDQPYWMRTTDQPLVAVPYTVETNDITLCLSARCTGPEFVQAVRDQFDTLYRDSATAGRVMCLALHPFIMGQPLRARYLQEALAYIASFEDVARLTGREIDFYFRKSQREI